MSAQWAAWAHECTNRVAACYCSITVDTGSNRVNIVLDAEHSEKLRRLAERTHVAPGTLARALLTTAIEEADPSPRNVTALLDGIDGALEAAERGLAEVEYGNVVLLEDL